MGTSLTSLPLEVLLLAASHLTSSDFLNLCSTCHAFQDSEDLRYSPAYWSKILRSTFRVPNQPVVASDGRRWQNLYRRMLKQTRVYAWGNNDRGSLGKPLPPIVLHFGRGPRYRPHVAANRGGVGEPTAEANFPIEVDNMNQLGVIADLQCGGWSTAALTAKGEIYINGVFEQEQVIRGLTKLKFPQPMASISGMFSQTSSRWEERMAHFSLGRAHLVALSDTGRIWAWNNATAPGYQVKFFSIDLVHRPPETESVVPGQINKVVAGWNRSSAYVVGKGIVVWQPVANGEFRVESDTALVTKTWIVPLTSYHRSADVKSSDRDAEVAGEVINWILLENFIVFITHLHKVYAVQIPPDWDAITHPYPLKRSSEMFSATVATDSTPARRYLDPKDIIIDVQGSYRSFALMTLSGLVLTGTADQLEALTLESNDELQAQESPPEIPFTLLPCLQKSGVIALAFGDWHFHALHGDGTITSHGKELQCCGVLGLGPLSYDSGIRGVQEISFLDGGLRDRHLPSTSESYGRRVIFEQEKKAFLSRIWDRTNDALDTSERWTWLSQRDDVRAEVSEWVEQRLRTWEDNCPAQTTSVPAPDDDGLPAYFALSVAAAGWHSGALVLVNEEKARRVRNSYWCPKQPTATADSPNREDANTAEPSAANDQSSLWDRANMAALDYARGFLGLPTSTSEADRGPDNAQDAAAGTGKGHWSFDDVTLPRLRLANGDVMPGTRPVEDWQCPPWKEIEEIYL